MRFLNEYHYSSLEDSAKELYENEDRRTKSVGAIIGDWNEDISLLKLIIISTYLVHQTIHSGEFIKQISHSTYSDEQN